VRHVCSEIIRSLSVDQPLLNKPADSLMRYSASKTTAIACLGLALSAINSHAASAKYVDKYGKPCVSSTTRQENLEMSGARTVILYTMDLVNGCGYNIEVEAVTRSGGENPAVVPANSSTYVKCTDHSQAQADCGGWAGFRETHRSP
jgi:hypothetical protein